jgi:pimeloyl-ACP methyl ester carboxylesterase
MPLSIPGPTSHSYFSQRLRLHYVDWGNEDAPPLLLIHGGRDHCRNWDWVAEQLRNDYHVIAPDLRGHGDSQWMLGGTYSQAEFAYDIAQLIHQLKLSPLTIIGHSMGSGIGLRYTGIYPENVKKFVGIEGLGSGPPRIKDRSGLPPHEKFTVWIDETRALAARVPRRYATFDDALKRMQETNKHLSADQARHLTIHGINQNEDGTYSWKFDNYVRAFTPFNIDMEETRSLWQRITCPTLLIRGGDSWAEDPYELGIPDHFQTANFVTVDGAGHWVHHDKLDEFLKMTRDFLAD